VRAASQDAEVTEQRLTAFRFLFLSFVSTASEPIVMELVTTTGFI
jgi:hypothetical protein